MKHIFVFFGIISLASCSMNEQDGEVVWKSRHSGGFKAEVPSSYTAADMQRKFGDYCEKQGKITRSLVMERKDGKKIVVGRCMEV